MPENQVNIPSSFDLKDLMNMEKNPAIQQQVQQLFQNQMNEHHQQPKNEHEPASKEELRKRLRAKIDGMKGQRMGKEYQEQKQMEQLRNNNMVSQMGKNVDIDLMVDQVIKEQSLPNVAQQRKAIKKRIEAMMNKL